MSDADGQVSSLQIHLPEKYFSVPVASVYANGEQTISSLLEDVIGAYSAVDMTRPFDFSITSDQYGGLPGDLKVLFHYPPYLDKNRRVSDYTRIFPLVDSTLLVCSRPVVTASYGADSRGGTPTISRRSMITPSPSKTSKEEEPAAAAQGEAEEEGLLQVVMRFPEQYPIPEQTMQVPANIPVYQVIPYVLEELLVSDDEAHRLVLKVPESTDGSHVRRFKRSALFPYLPTKSKLDIFRNVLGEIPYLDMQYMPKDRWQYPVRAGNMLIKEAEESWVKCYALLKDRQLFYFDGTPATELVNPIGRVFLNLSTYEAVKGGDSQVIKLTEKIGSKLKVIHVASKSKSNIAAWCEAIELELAKLEAESSAPPPSEEHEEEGQPAYDPRRQIGANFEALEARKTMNLKSLVSKKNPSKEYGEFNKIGRGAFSNVWTAVSTVTGEKVAIKVIKIEKKTFKYVKQEVITLQRFESHPNIVSYINSYVLSKVQQLWIVMEFLGGGALIDYVSIDIPFPESQISFVARESFKALAYMHSKDRMHRDIKSGNILISAEGGVKLGDFGFAVKLAEGKTRAKTILGTPLWMAPEIHARSQYGAEVDMWAMGIVCIEMAEGQPPYKGMTREEIRLQVQTNGAFISDKEAWSAEFNSFLESLLQMDAANRPVASEVLEHPFLRIHNDDRLTVKKVPKKKKKKKTKA